MVMNDDNGDYAICDNLKKVEEKIKEIVENHDNEYVQECVKIFPIGKQVNFSIETAVKIERS